MSFSTITNFSPAYLPHLQESPVANRIKEAFFSEKGLAGNVHRLPFDKLFAIDSVKKVGWPTSTYCLPLNSVS